MSKYNKIMSYDSNLNNPLVDGEELIWSAKPKKSAYIINQVLIMMPFALLWLAIDSSFIFTMFASGEMSSMLLVVIPFFALHLMPVWIWLGNIITSNRKWKNTKYYVTDKRIIIQNGLIAENYQTIYYKDIKNVSLRIGLIDKLLNVGDIYFDLGHYMRGQNTKVVSAAFLDIDNVRDIYPKLQKIVMDIQTDIEYPNALRPDNNPGYDTKYNGKI